MKTKTARDKQCYNAGVLQGRDELRNEVLYLQEEIKKLKEKNTAQRYQVVTQLMQQCANNQEAITRLVIAAEKQF